MTLAALSKAEQQAESCSAHMSSHALTVQLVSVCQVLISLVWLEEM